MKIVCDNCATKYSIADEKVRGKVFKIRCKKCSHIIVVRGNEGGEAPADAGEQNYADEQATVAAGPSAPAAGAGASADSVWHLVIDREQVGPMTPAEVRAKVAAGQADAETYAWREGFGDWLRLASIDEFKDLGGGGAARNIHDASTELGATAGSGDGATRRSDPADVFASQQKEEDDGGAADLFGGAKAPAPASASFAAAASSSGGDDLFSGAATAASAAPGLFGAPAAEAPRPRASASPFGGGSPSVGDNGGGSAVETKMTGQRNENSVLFSLNNLQALATSGSGSKPAADAPAARPGYASSKNEGSGLIDIRAMAAQTLSATPSSSSSDNADIPAFSASPVFSPVVAAPILMPTPSTGMPKWVWGVLGGGVLAVGAIVVLLVVVLKKPPEPTNNSELLAQLTSQLNKNNAGGLGAAPANVGGAKAPDAPPAKGDAPAADAKEKSGDKPAASDKEDKKGHAAHVGGGGSKHTATAPSKGGDAPPPVATPSAPPPEKKKPKGGGDSLDELLDGATGGGKPDKPSRPAKVEAPPDNPDLPDQLGRADIVAGMGGIKGKVDSCAAQYHVPGTAMVQVTIGKAGRVTSATVGGALAGTPSGDCVARAVKSASFKKFKGQPMSIAYPFILRP